jgi:hypothetical protein
VTCSYRNGGGAIGCGGGGGLDEARALSVVVVRELDERLPYHLLRHTRVTP